MLYILSISNDESNVNLLITVINMKTEHLQMWQKESCQEQGKECTPLRTIIITSLYLEDIISIIFIIYIKVLEANIIPFRISIIEAWVHITLHLVEQVQIIHQLMKYITPTTLPTSFTLFLIKQLII